MSWRKVPNDLNGLENSRHKISAATLPTAAWPALAANRMVANHFNSGFARAQIHQHHTPFRFLGT